MTSNQQQSPPRDLKIFDPQTPVSVDGLYIHIPYCRQKCAYCDFYSVTRTDDLSQLISHMAGQIHQLSRRLTAPLQTLYIGGGTPSSLPAEAWASLGLALDQLPMADNAESTVEANPETLTRDWLLLIRRHRINRISIGAQSFDDRELAILGRRHTARQIHQAVEQTHRCGFENISLDLIFAIPGQKVDQWMTNLRTAVELEPTHLSCYGLTVEPGTPLAEQLADKRYTPCPESEEAEMFTATRQSLQKAGYDQYEISNYARPGHASRHNLLYWTDRPFWAIGPSAAGYCNGIRWHWPAEINTYLNCGDRPPVNCTEQLDTDRAVGERFMLQLRTTAGLPMDWVNQQAGNQRQQTIDRFIDQQLLRIEDQSLQLTERGLLLADTIFAELI